MTSFSISSEFLVFKFLCSFNIMTLEDLPFPYLEPCILQSDIISVLIYSLERKKERKTQRR